MFSAIPPLEDRHLACLLGGPAGTVQHRRAAVYLPLSSQLRKARPSPLSGEGGIPCAAGSRRVFSAVRLIDAVKKCPVLTGWT